MHRLTLILLAATLAAQPPKASLSVDLQAAIQKETVQGDLKSAIAMYEKIVALSGADRDTTAKALLRIGQCQEKLGNAEARKAYERIVREFADQSGAAEARNRLAALGGPAAGPKIVYSDPNIYGPRSNRDGRFVAALCAEAPCVIEVATGVQRKLALAPAAPKTRNWRPLASPDGQSIAYVHFSDRNGAPFAELRVKLQGQPNETTLASGLNDTFSPVDWTADGKSVLFAKIDSAGAAGLYLIPATGGAPRQLDAPGFDWSAGRDYSRLSPDGKWLAYPSSKRELQGGGYVPTDVQIISTKGGEAVTAMGGASEEWIIGWLASGDLVVSSTRSSKRLPYRIHVVDGKPQGEPVLLETDLGESSVIGVNMQSGAQLLLKHTRRNELQAFHPSKNTSRPFPLGYQADSPVFSPNGRMLAYATGPIDGSNSIVIRDLATGEDRRLHGEIPRIINLGWYPDNRHLFAICNTRNWRTRPFFRFDTVTGAMKPLPDIIGLSAWWTPAILADGRTLLYTGSGDQNGKLVVLDTETGSSRTLLEAQVPFTDIASFALSSDRKTAVYGLYAKGSDHSALARIDIADPQPRIFYECQERACAPAVPFFAPNQRDIVFWRGLPKSGPSEELWQVPLAGGESKLVKKHPFTPPGLAFHPETGEIVLGSATFNYELRSK